MSSYLIPSYLDPAIIHMTMRPKKIDVEQWVIKRKYGKHKAITIDKIVFRQRLIDILPRIQWSSI